MLKKTLLLIAVFFLFQNVVVFAGIEWKAKITETPEKGKGTIILSHLYAQNGNVRHEFTDVSGNDNTLQEEGTYWLYQGANQIIFIVHPKKKTYMEMPLNALSQMTSSVNQFIKMTISNPSVEVTPLAKETISSYDCEHLKIKMIYDMETKIAFMKMKNHVEQVQEIWATNAVSTRDIAATFQSKSFKTGIDDLDLLLQKQMESQKNLGFIIKSITTNKNTDQKGKSELKTTEMIVSDILDKTLNNDLFNIPTDYQKTEMIPGKSGN